MLDLFGGAEGNRTPDLCSAIAALSHLSYGPDPLGKKGHIEGASTACQASPDRGVRNGLVATRSYTQDYELSRCELTDGALPVIDLSYARGDQINLTAITDNVTAANSATFGYSAANRLNSAAGP